MRKQLILLSTLFILLTSCEKVIDVDLQNSDPLLVIEANLIAGEQDFVVNISKSTDFFLDTPIEYIDDATVTLYRENEILSVIPRTSKAQYSEQITAQEETMYTLEVELDGKTYRASSFMPKKVEIMETSFEFQEAGGPLDEGYVITVSFSDPAETEGFYRIVTYDDGVINNAPDDLQIFDDRLFNGGNTNLSLSRFPFDPGTNVTLELRTLNAEGYDYFNSLAGTLGSDQGLRGGQAAPGNPNTNWDEDILGHFTAYSIDEISIQLPE